MSLLLSCGAIDYITCCTPSACLPRSGASSKNIQTNHMPTKQSRGFYTIFYPLSIFLYSEGSCTYMYNNMQVCLYTCSRARAHCCFLGQEFS